MSLNQACLLFHPWNRRKISRRGNPLENLHLWRHYLGHCITKKEGNMKCLRNKQSGRCDNWTVCRGMDTYVENRDIEKHSNLHCDLSVNLENRGRLVFIFSSYCSCSLIIHNYYLPKMRLVSEERKTFDVGEIYFFCLNGRSWNLWDHRGSGRLTKVMQIW